MVAPLSLFRRKYGVTEEETAYVLDPKAVYSDDFPGETFRVLKENEIKRYGEYRTRRLVLHYYHAWRDRAWDEFDRWLSPRAAPPAAGAEARPELVLAAVGAGMAGPEAEARRARASSPAAGSADNGTCRRLRAHAGDRVHIGAALDRSHVFAWLPVVLPGGRWVPMPVYRRNDRYPMVRLESAQDWEALLDLCDGSLDRDRLSQLRHLLGEACRTVILERDYVCKDHRDTYTNYYAKKFATHPDKCLRLLFFRKRVGPGSWWNVPSYADSFIGYAVIRPSSISPLGRTILDPQACAGVQGYMCRTRYTANLMGTELRVNGFPHISQDTDVTVCAHAACWSCFRYFTERYPTYPEIYPYQITQLTTDLSEGRLLPSRGLYMEQVVEMFSRFGFYPRIYFRRDWDRNAQRFERLLYSYQESGLPLVLGIDPDHAVVAIGHTSDFSLPLPTGQAFSEGYLTGLVINDDNFMPYQVLPRDGHEQQFALRRHVSPYRLSQIDSFVVPLYEKIYLAAEDVERWALVLLADREYGLDSQSAIRLGDCVLRVFLTTSRAYKAERRVVPLPHDLSRLYTQLPMPKFIWVCELSTKEVYPSGKILGEII